MPTTLVLAVLPGGGQLQARRDAWAAVSEGAVHAGPGAGPTPPGRTRGSATAPPGPAPPADRRGPPRG